MFRRQQEEYTKMKLDAEKSLRQELSEKTGFLEELNAILLITMERVEARVFYGILFFFLLLLELFVVLSKILDKKCDYDKIVEHQLRTRKYALGALLKNDSADNAEDYK